MQDLNRFAQRRQRFLERLDAGVVILPAAHEAIRSHDTEYPFRQDSDFYYLTGFPEPDAKAVFRPGHEKPYVLFVRPRDREKEIWTGYRIGVEGALERYGADEVYPLSEWNTRLPALLENQRRIYVRLGKEAELDRQLIDTVTELRRKVRQGVVAPSEIIDPGAILAGLIAGYVAKLRCWRKSYWPRSPSR